MFRLSYFHANEYVLHQILPRKAKKRDTGQEQ